MNKVKLYKFRSLKDFYKIADIFVNTRFYAARYTELNDPMEEIYDCFEDIHEKYVQQIAEGKRKLRICSFTSEYTNLLLWAHYADGFNGICVEVEVDKDNYDFEYVEVNYSPFKVIVTNEDSTRLDEYPKIILSGKNDVWEYENEVRLFSRSKFINKGIKITKVLIGVRTTNEMKKVMRSILPMNIPLHETFISPSTNEVEINTNSTTFEYKK